MNDKPTAPSPRRVDITGNRYGMLVAIEFDHHSRGATYWRFRCDCGNEKVIQMNRVRSGRTVSCGCYSKAYRPYFTMTHGESRTRLYRIWGHMKQRCYNPNHQEYERYGGRGIRMCDEWANSFEAFKEWALSSGYQDDLTIDRRDNDDGYSPKNCRWMSLRDQQRNKSGVTLGEYEGKYYTAEELSEILGETVWSIKKKFGSGKINTITGPEWCLRQEACYGRLI